jgi:hypothetical protein
MAPFLSKWGAVLGNFCINHLMRWYISNISIIFYAPCLFIHHFLCVLFTLRGVFMYFLELTY